MEEIKVGQTYRGGAWVVAYIEKHSEDWYNVGIVNTETGETGERRLRIPDKIETKK
jgi:hypothetical protein